MKWAATVPLTLRNPLYHWTHLELKAYFGISSRLNESTAREIYDQANHFLAQEEYRSQSLLTKKKLK